MGAGVTVGVGLVVGIALRAVVVVGVTALAAVGSGVAGWLLPLLQAITSAAVPNSARKSAFCLAWRMATDTRGGVFIVTSTLSADA